MANKSKYLLSGLAVIAVAFGIAFFNFSKTEKPAQPVPQTPTLQKEAFLQTHTIYLLCGHSDTKKKTLPEELVGLTQEQVQKFHPDWEIITFEPKLLAVRIKFEALDEQCANRKYLGLSDGKVAIFRGMPGRGVVEKITAIRADKLPASEVEALRAGLEVASEGELLEILEGLAEGEEKSLEDL